LTPPAPDDVVAAMIAERTIEGIPVLTLASSELGGIEAAFAPSAGMVGCSLRHRGEELLGQRGGLRRYIREHSTMGIPLLYPWANRLGAKRFSVGGRELNLDSTDLPLSFDQAGLPIHGLLAAASGWRVDRHQIDGDRALLAASFDFGADQELLAAFPFPHQVHFEASLRRAVLTITTTVHAPGEASVPVSFGFHPYLRLPAIDRADWEIEVPVRERLELDSRQLPTGTREPVRIGAGPLGSRVFDDAYTAPVDEAPFVLAGGRRRIELRAGAGYGFAQVYAPSDDQVIAFEPMTAPTNALLSDGSELVLVRPGERFAATFSITLIDRDS
jgi:aldose 1-epimerase